MRLFAFVIIFVFVALHIARANTITDAAKKGDLEQLLRLIDEGGDLNETGTFGTPLHWAALNGHADAVDLLASRGADLSISSDALGTPLHAAAQRGFADVVSVLVKHGADLNSRNRYEFTPLMLAAQFGHLDVAAALMSGGADPNAIGKGQGAATYGFGNLNALHLALSAGHEEVADALRQSGATPLEPKPIINLLDLADVARGRKAAFTWCRECHVVQEGQHEPMNLTAGPSLITIFGRGVGSEQTYQYSMAMQAAGGNWDEDSLYNYITEPMLALPGTRMVYVQDWSPEEVVDMIAYFKSLSQ